MSWKEEYERWLADPKLDQELRTQLEDLAGNDKTLEDAFYKNLEFGTGGMRGEIGPGTNRMNIYTIRKAAEGLAQYIEQHGEEAKKRGVVIAYDCRHKSPEFAMEAARAIGQHGIQTYVFEELRPTPELSFAVRELKAYAGIVITASHNPPEYNGFKVYNEDGGQLPPKVADEVIAKVNQVANELAVEIADEETLHANGLLKMVGPDMDEKYINKVVDLSLNPDIIQEMKDDLKIVFTPLHGTANKPVRQGLEKLGFNQVTIVTEQEEPDPNFSTVKSPNPEEHAAFELAIQYAKKQDADILIGTDPDADRLGVAVKNEYGEYTVLTGNQTGALILHYLLSQKKKKGILPDNGVVLKTIVTSEIGRDVAESYGLTTVDTLTGFKFIGEKIKEYEESGQHTFQFGYEESYGYLIGDFARDKDAVQAAIMACEVAAFYKKQGKTLYQGLLDIFEEYGYYREDLVSLTLKGKEGAEQIVTMMNDFRSNPPREINGTAVVTIEDYQNQVTSNLITARESIISLPKSNVIKFFLEDGSWFCLRPSGTEPKIKFYFGVKGKSLEHSEQVLESLKETVMAQVHQK